MRVTEIRRANHVGALLNWTQGACAALLVALTGCAATQDASRPASLPNADTIAAALKGAPDEASAASIRRALQLRPRDAGLHFVNGLTYHRAAEQGAQSSLDLAQVGYETAARLDPGFWPARAGLGWLAYEQRRPDDAMLRFADALLLAPKRAELWVGLAAAAYDAHKLSVARAAIDRALELAPERADAQRVAALVFAASGDDKAARARLADYAAAMPQQAGFVAERLDNWSDLHRSIERSAGPAGARLQLAASFPPDPSAGGNTSSSNSDSDSSSSSSGDYSDDTSDASDGSPGSYYGPRALRPLKSRAGADPKMVLVDVVIIREEETSSTGKGVNLLDGLQVQLGGSLTVQSQTGQAAGASSFTRVLAGAVTIPTVTYDLDIANVSGTRAEVVARPTLVALDGQSSRFFSGDELTIALAGQYGGDLEHKAIGIGLSVTPTIAANNKVLLRVITERESISPQLAGTFAQSVQTTRNTVTANVSMRFGETLVLSGLLDREAKSARSGVPVLQSIPGVQYLFSRDEDSRSQRSLIVTMTPRRPDGAQLATRAESAERDRVLGTLESRVPAFHPDPSLDRVIAQLEEHGMLREFRAGDLGIRTVEEMRDPGLLQQALRFLYY